MSEDLVKEFLVESHENLDRLDLDLVNLEKDPRNAETLGSVFRTIHTIKGTCGFLAFGKLEAISHEGESLLSKMRDGGLLLNAEVTTGLLAMVDAIRQVLAQIEQTGVEGDRDYGDLIAQLKRLNEAGPTEDTAPAPERTVHEGGERRSPEDRRSGDDRRAGAADSSLRIDVGLLDRLMNLVGELVLARNQIHQFTATQTDSSFIGATQRLDLVTSELQECVMRTRMQPIGNVWSKFPRIVRDLAVQCGKQVRIEMEGKDTELDKTIIEAIKDPLTHVVRNSVDHGIELPAIRLQRGKPAEGRIRLRAFHEGGRINIEISDDGNGIDPARIRTKAIQCGLVSTEQASRMADHEVLRLVFLPGLTTAETVSNISGRGVGMDVVKTNIEKSGGEVDIHSRPGEGTTLKIKIPVTLAVIPALTAPAGTVSGVADPKTILLVDDDGGVRGLVARLLRARGYQVLEASSGEQAQAISRQHQGPLHLLLCDMAMDGMSGPELAERLAQTRPGLRMLMMSGDPAMASVVDERLRSAEFIGKPFTPQALADNVRVLLATA